MIDVEMETVLLVLVCHVARGGNTTRIRDYDIIRTHAQNAAATAVLSCILFEDRILDLRILILVVQGGCKLRSGV